MLSKEKYEHFMSIYTKGEGNTYYTDHPEEINVGTVTASTLTDEQIQAYEDAKSDEVKVVVKDSVVIDDPLEAPTHDEITNTP